MIKIEPAATATAQRTLDALAGDLIRIDEALARVVDSLDDVPGDLPRDVASAADAVRRDLLDDAVDTLRGIAAATEATARRRRRNLEESRSRAAGAGFRDG
ncbi:MAG: hypothetical protein AAFY88_23025 [Acidobacteriota bacterium]